jgi:hypothetical protein
MLEERLFCLLLGVFFMIVLLRWPCFEYFRLDNDTSLKKDTECEQCCNSLINETKCDKVCIFRGEKCRCCSRN